MVEVTNMLPKHAGAVLQIYAEGLATGQATFNTQVPSWEAWDKDHHVHSRLVAVDNGEVLGWAALSPVSAFFTCPIFINRPFLTLWRLGNAFPNIIKMK